MQQENHMKAILAALVVCIVGCSPAIAQDALTPVSVAATPDSAAVAVDALAIGQSMSSVSRVGLGTWWRQNVQPVKFWQNNWKGIVASAAIAGASYAAYEIYDHNKSRGSSSKASDENAAPEIPDTITLGDQTYIGIEGDGNFVTIYNSSPVSAPAAE
jgi:hypothetical protein